MAIAVFASVVAILLAGILLMRFRKRWLAAFNLAATNRISSRFAPRLPGFGIVTHVGRKPGRVYPTPVNVFPRPKGFLMGLPYGRIRKSAKMDRLLLTLAIASLAIGYSVS